jgi:hypothetical protein
MGFQTIILTLAVISLNVAAAPVFGCCGSAGAVDTNANLPIQPEVLGEPVLISANTGMELPPDISGDEALAQKLRNKEEEEQKIRDAAAAKRERDLAAQKPVYTPPPQRTTPNYLPNTYRQPQPQRSAQPSSWIYDDDFHGGSFNSHSYSQSNNHYGGGSNHHSSGGGHTSHDTSGGGHTSHDTSSSHDCSGGGGGDF